MTRHGRNATNSAVYSYHERHKDAAASGFGSEKCRLNKDSLKGFDCCSLTLQPCRNPVVTQDGWLFDKEAVLKYMIEKKEEYSRKMKEFERQKVREERDQKESEEADRILAVEKFEKSEKSILPKSVTGADGQGGSKGTMPSFWLPSLTPQAEKTKLTKPDKTVYCPMSGKPLKLKDLIEVKFKEIRDDDEPTNSKGKKRSLIAREERYVCAVTNDVLNNSTPVAVLKPTGDVVTVECVDKIIRKDMVHPLTGQTLKEEDIIPLQRGGTGYSAANDTSLNAKRHRPQLAIS